MRAMTVIKRPARNKTDFLLPPNNDENIAPRLGLSMNAHRIPHRCEWRFCRQVPFIIIVRLTVVAETIMQISFSFATVIDRKIACSALKIADVHQRMPLSYL